MGQLADTLAEFLTTVGSVARERELLPDALRFPRGGTPVFRGSDMGAELWSTPAGAVLLNLASRDPAILAAFGGNWDPVHEARLILAGVVQRWRASGTDPVEFASSVEGAVWDSLRRSETVAIAVAVAEGLIAPPGGLELPYSRRIDPPNEEFMRAVFPGAWPEYRIRLPAGPFVLLGARVSARRDLFSGMVTTAFARIKTHSIRNAIWLATGVLPRLGDTVIVEEHTFPLSQPHHVDPEPPSLRTGPPVDLEPFRNELAALAPRLGALDGDNTEPPSLDADTETTLRTVRAQADALIHTSDSVLSLLLAFAAAEGSLTELGESSNAAHGRYGILCGSDSKEQRRLREIFEALDPVRDAAAHGARPTSDQIGRLTGGSAAAAGRSRSAAWFPLPWDSSEEVTRELALDIMRRLYRAWLLAAMRIEDGRVVPGLTRDQLIELLRGARSATEVKALRQRIQPEDLSTA